MEIQYNNTPCTLQTDFNTNAHILDTLASNLDNINNIVLLNNNNYNLIENNINNLNAIINNILDTIYNLDITNNTELIDIVLDLKNKIFELENKLNIIKMPAEQINRTIYALGEDINLNAYLPNYWDIIGVLETRVLYTAPTGETKYTLMGGNFLSRETFIYINGFWYPKTEANYLHLVQ